MNNNKIAFISANILVLAALLIICFLFSAEYTPLFWWSLTFLVIAFAIEICLNIGVLDDQNSIEMYFFGLPLTYLSGVYVVVESIVCLLFSLFLNFGLEFGVTVQMLILVIFGVMMIIAYINKNILLENDSIRTEQRTYMATAASKLKEIEGSADSREIRSKIHSLYEASKMSDPKVSEELYDIEDRIDEKINQLKELVNNTEIANDIILEIKKMIDERNGICLRLK